MPDWVWILWSVLGAILIVAEIFTSGFVLLWFGIGALPRRSLAWSVSTASWFSL